MDKVLVLMSTYNGEKYIQEQVDSILNQKNVLVDILFRDDGSVDGTVGILKQYKEKYPDRIKYDIGENIGAKKSFLSLICMASEEYDFFALSDQDDIWKLEKISRGVDLLRSYNQKNPLIYGSPATLYSDGAEGKIVFNESTHYSLGNFLIKNYFPGCTAVFNKQLKKLISMVNPSELSETPLHDHWMNLVCTSCGGTVVIDTQSLIDYRQHGGNVVGGERNLIKKIADNGILSSNNMRLKHAKELFHFYSEYMTDESRTKIQKIINYKVMVGNRIKLAFDKEIKPVNKVEIVVAAVNVILGRF